MNEKYNSIINMKHHVSLAHKHMSNNDRAAQFMPFAALTGYDKAILEASRLTVLKKNMSEEEKKNINDILIRIKGKKNIVIKMIYFKKDAHKSGGQYIDYIGYVKKIDEINKTLILEEKNNVSFSDILTIEII